MKLVIKRKLSHFKSEIVAVTITDYNKTYYF